MNHLKVEWQLTFISISSEYDNYCLILIMDFWLGLVCVIDELQGSKNLLKFYVKFQCMCIFFGRGEDRVYCFHQILKDLA